MLSGSDSIHVRLDSNMLTLSFLLSLLFPWLIKLFYERWICEQEYGGCGKRGEIILGDGTWHVYTTKTKKNKYDIAARRASAARARPVIPLERASTFCYGMDHLLASTGPSAHGGDKNDLIAKALIPVLQKRHGNSKFKFKITSYYSLHYSNSAVTIQIRGTIQNIRYYSNSEYE